MPAIVLDGAEIVGSRARDHITYNYEYWDSCADIVDGECEGDWVEETDKTDAIVHGSCNASSNRVYVNGQRVVLQNDSTTEYDEIDYVSGGYNYRGDHRNASGRVTSGNSRNVYINNKLVAVIGSSVSTHANTSSSIQSGGSSNVFIGG